MKFSIKQLLILILLVAAFCGGWAAKTNYDLWQAQKELIPPPAIYTIPSFQPVIDSVVLKTQGDLAAIAVGADDGISVGDAVQFYRDSELIGSGEVGRVKANMSAVRVLGGVEVLESDRAIFK